MASYIVILWAKMVESGQRTIEEVPTKLRKQVEEYLNEFK